VNDDPNVSGLPVVSSLFRRKGKGFSFSAGPSPVVQNTLSSGMQPIRCCFCGLGCEGD
jgi:hypothetical protein